MRIFPKGQKRRAYSKHSNKLKRNIQLADFERLCNNSAMARKMGIPLHGWINLDKPKDMSSTQALSAVKRILNPKKAGHAGTLDPLATGVLPIALGHATKLVNYAQNAMKHYEFTITWGERRDTEDLEGNLIAVSQNRPKLEEVIAALPGFTGEIEQMPPKYSAVKIQGQRAYDLARAGEEFAITPRTIFIEYLNIIAADEGSVSLECYCGKGTYVRSIARDLAHLLNTEGYISSLRRTSVGPFRVEDAVSLDVWKNLSDKEQLEEALLPLESVLDDIPALSLSDAEAVRLKNGNALSFVSRGDFDRLITANINTGDGDVAAAFFQERLIAIVEITGPRINPVRVFKD